MIPRMHLQKHVEKGHGHNASSSNISNTVHYEIEGHFIKQEPLTITVFDSFSTLHNTNIEKELNTMIKVEESDVKMSVEEYEKRYYRSRTNTNTFKQEQNMETIVGSTAEHKRQYNNHELNDDRQFHCYICSRNFANNDTFAVHLTKFHRMTMIYNDQKVKVDPDLTQGTNYCQSCEMMFYSNTQYRFHLLQIHKIKRIQPSLNASSGSSLSSNNATATSNDKNCNNGSSTRKRKFSRRPGRRKRNLNSFASKQTTGNPNIPSLQPDINDPNNFCLLCNITYSGLGRYRDHLRRVHKMKLTPLRTIFHPKPGVTPDPEDPNHYCRACEASFQNLCTYRLHLRSRHKMKLESRRQARFRKTNDKNEMKCIDYCHICHTTYSRPEYLNRHVKENHGGKCDLDGKIPVDKRQELEDSVFNQSVFVVIKL
ncbi:MAG: hypothetical protein EXX96DRAFT_580596 [Benjaminiella poitrasii]|nr:MAG: hypothetical protein EXX96DRAFT_580596 [Benjaminiella poitrasii]